MGNQLVVPTADEGFDRIVWIANDTDLLLEMAALSEVMRATISLEEPIIVAAHVLQDEGLPLEEAPLQSSQNEEASGLSIEQEQKLMQVRELGIPTSKMSDSELIAALSTNGNDVDSLISGYYDEQLRQDEELARRLQEEEEFPRLNQDNMVESSLSRPAKPVASSKPFESSEIAFDKALKASFEGQESVPDASYMLGYNKVAASHGESPPPDRVNKGSEESGQNEGYVNPHTGTQAGYPKCEICDLTVSSFLQLEEHLGGKKHKDRVAQLRADGALGEEPKYTKIIKDTEAEKEPMTPSEIQSRIAELKLERSRGSGRSFLVIQEDLENLYDEYAKVKATKGTKVQHNHPCRDYIVGQKNSCRFGASCQFLHNGVHGGGNPPESSVASSGFVFLCNEETEQEVKRLKLFGSPAKEIVRLRKNIQADTSLFLWNFHSNTLCGVFSATSLPGLDLVPSAFGGKFPAQVRVEPKGTLMKVRLDQRLQGGVLSIEETASLSQKLGLKIPGSLAHDDDATRRARERILMRRHGDAEDSKSPDPKYYECIDMPSDKYGKQDQEEATRKVMKEIVDSDKEEKKKRLEQLKKDEELELRYQAKEEEERAKEEEEKAFRGECESDK